MGSADGVTRPTVLHVMAYPLRRRTHPAIHRTVTPLDQYFRNLALCGRSAGYYPTMEASTPEPEEAMVEVVNGAPHEIKRPAAAQALASQLKSRYGRGAAVVAHLGPNGWISMHLARALSAPILTIFHGADADAEIWSQQDGPAYRRLRRAPGAAFLG